MSKDEISLVFDLVLQKRDDFSGINAKVKEILKKSKVRGRDQRRLSKNG